MWIFHNFFCTGPAQNNFKMQMPRNPTYYFIIFLTFAKLTQSRFKVSTENKLSPFHFLVGGDEIHVSLAAQLNRIGLNIEINTTPLEIKGHTSAITMTIQNWERYAPFTQDEALKTEYLTMTSAGLPLFRKAVKNLDKILSYLSTTPYIFQHTCTLVPRNFTGADFAKADYNLAKRYSHIDATWTPASIKSDKGQSNTLLMFALYLNEIGQYLFDQTEELLTLLERLSDNEFPAQLEPEIQTSKCVPQEAGEKFIIQNCEKSTKGLMCTMQATVPKRLQTFTEMHRISYENIALESCEDCKFLQTQETGTLNFVDCTTEIQTTEDFPLCKFVPLSDGCLKDLEGNKVTDIINNCEFDEFFPDTVTLLPGSGALIQATDDASISSGPRPISEKSPIVIFSPDPVTIVDLGKELSIPANENISALTVVSSLLTNADIKKLKRKYNWDKFQESLGTDDYIRFTALGLQVIFVPLSVGFSIFLYLKNKKQMNDVKIDIGKANFQEMQQLFKPRKK